MSTMRWVRVVPTDLKGQPPIARSGHSAVRVGKSMVVIFGGLLDKRFLSDLVVLDFEKKLWFKPECTGSETDGQVGPSPRAFHVAVSIDCHMFIFGGRCGRKRLGDFWMLDTDIWQWTELTGYGDLPPARDFAAGVAVGNRKLVMHGGWDGSKWLSDVYVLDTMTLEWTQLPITGSSPTPRCGHTATMVERRLLIFGGRGGGGPIMGDLWALKGLFEEENESPAWTQLKLSGQAPTARCGHTVTSGGTQLLVFGGHGTGGWLTRYDVYYNDCIVLDRSSVQWKRLPINNEPPSARAYHTMTRVGSRFFLFGGYDGKSTFGDMWWLVAEDDPIAKRASQPPGECISFSETLITDDPSQENTMVEGNTSLRELRNRLGLPNMVSFATQFKVVDISEDKELLALASMLVPRRSDEQKEQNVLIKEMREKWKESTPASIKLRELGPLFRDYQRLVCHLPCKPDLRTCRFYHLMDAKQLRMSDIPYLLNEYKEILSMSTYKFS